MTKHIGGPRPEGGSPLDKLQQAKRQEALRKLEVQREDLAEVQLPQALKDLRDGFVGKLERPGDAPPGMTDLLRDYPTKPGLDSVLTPKPIEVRPKYGAPGPIDLTPEPIEVRPKYGAPAPVDLEPQPIEVRPKYGAPGPVDLEPQPIEVRPKYGAPGPIEVEPQPIEVRPKYGAPSAKLDDE